MATHSLAAAQPIARFAYPDSEDNAYLGTSNTLFSQTRTHHIAIAACLIAPFGNPLYVGIPYLVDN
jgi:hypothetical protein